MPKKCNFEGCNYNQFGGGYCRNHQYLRTDKKPKVLKKTKRPVNLKQLHDDWHFYLEIWNERPHLCENCGQWLGNEPLTLYFDHLLEKSKYPDLRYEKENIMLLCWQDHSSKTNGFPPEKVKQNIIKICEKFGKSIPFR
ncbi:MAG: HNH endonuclease signature motif containing protein [Nanoarchaeota archaeon]